MSVPTREITMPRLPAMRLRMPARRAAAVTGLEIGASEAIAAQARLVGGRIVAQRVAARPLPLGLVREGRVLDAERLAGELRPLFAEHGFAKRVRVGLATPRTILRVIDLPPLEERDIRPALTMQARERIPMPLDQAVMDFHPVGLIDTADGRRLRVIVVVTEREGIEHLMDAMQRAGLKPYGIDLSIFAAIRAVGAVPAPPGPVLYAQLGDLVTLAIVESGVCRFTRQAPQGMAMVIGRLAELRGISVAEAHEALQADRARQPHPGPEEGDEDVRTLLARVAVELGSELRTAADFYGRQFGAAAVTEGVVTGSLAPLPGFVPALAAASGLALRCGEVAVDDAWALGGVDARIAPVAAGLAVAEVAA